jgi:DNA-binding NarL/FixJ family response regulator
VVATDARIAIVGGADVLVTEALAWMVTSSGSTCVCYPDLEALRRAMRAGEHTPHAVVLDAEDLTAGPPAVRDLRRSHPQVRQLLVCERLSAAVVRCVVDEQIEGVVLKSDSPADVIWALQHVLAGRSVMPEGWHEATIAYGSILRTLSVRELEVLELASGGLNNREIAGRLVLSTNTVKFHLRNIYARLGVHNRVQASRSLEFRQGKARPSDEESESGSGKPI